MDKIIVKNTGKKITLRTAINKGILKDSSNFIVPEGKVIYRKGKSSKIIDINEAKKLYYNNEAGLHQIIGTFDVSSKTKNIIKSRIQNKTKEIIENKYKSSISRQVLTKEDKLNGFVVYNFIKDNHILGEGKFMILQGNRVIFEDNIDVGTSVSKWWKKEGGVNLGRVNSDNYIWNNINFGKDYNENLFKLKIEKMADGKIKRYFEYQKTTPQPTKSGKITKKSFSDAKKLDKQILEAYQQTKTTFVFIPDVKVNAKKINQIFRENANKTCFFDVIENYLNKKIKEVKTNKNYLTKLNKLNKFKNQYTNGMPEEHIQKICDEMAINIEIYDILGRCIRKYRSEKKPLTTIKYFNSRINHLDEFLDYDNNVILLNTYEEMLEIIKAEKNHFYYTGSIHKPNAIYTTHGTYKFNNLQNKTINDFNNSINLRDFAIDVIEEPKKYEYLINGVNYNSHCSFNKLSKMSKEEKKALKHNKEYCEPDMKKAYSQFKKCSEYMGFCNNMTPPLILKNWDVKKCKKYLGYYTCKVLSINNHNVKKIMKELGIDIGEKYVFSSPMISFLDKNGFNFEITEGSYSFKKYHIPDLPKEFFDKYTIDKQLITEEMEKDGVNGSSTYCIWAGKLNACNLTTNYKFYGSLLQAEILANEYDDVYINKYYNSDYDTKEIIDYELEEDNKIETRIKFNNHKVSWLGHIGGYITDYTRISVLEEMFKYDHSQIYGYKLDGFIIKGTFEDNELWRKKKVKADFDWNYGIFSPVFEEYGLDMHHLFKNRITLLSGAGGTGKSHSILENMKNTLFTSLMWRLNSEKMNEYKIKGLSWAQLAGIGCEPYLTKNRKPSIVFIDEITMIDKFQIYKLINELPFTSFYLGGDLEEDGSYYQCSFKDVNVLNINEIKGDVGVVKFTKNYRCKDEVLLNRLNSLRRFMKECNFDKNKITEYVKQEFKDRIIDFKKEDYDYKNDWILVSVIEGSQSQVKYYTDLCQGKKYRCVRHSSGELYKKLNGGDAYLNGEIMLDLDKENSKFVRQDAFTIHSFQGITIKKGQRMFIDMNRLFCPRQLYTALSRVEYLDQIFLI